MYSTYFLGLFSQYYHFPPTWLSLIINMNDQEIERQRLQQLHDSLPPKLPDVPSYLLELNRNQKKLTEIRMHRANEKEMPELEKRYQGQVL